MSELLFRLLLTLLITIPWILGLHWIWFHQLDPRETLMRWTRGVTEPPSWVATREPSKLYQGGKPVGDVLGPVEEKDGRFHFLRLANTSGLDRSREFQYPRLNLRIVSVAASYGMKSEVRTLDRRYSLPCSRAWYASR
jgi:hypothetical protein